MISKIIKNPSTPNPEFINLFTTLEDQIFFDWTWDIWWKKEQDTII